MTCLRCPVLSAPSVLTLCCVFTTHSQASFRHANPVTLFPLPAPLLAPPTLRPEGEVEARVQ